MKSLSLKRLALLIFVVVPIAAWFVVKPIRVLAPGLISITCPVDGVCLDDASKVEEAKALHAEGRAFVASALTPLSENPKVIYCATVACAESFGLGARSAVTVGRFGTVIGPRAWKPYYVRHEMIHVLQAEQIGVIPLLFKPSWFVEGIQKGELVELLTDFTGEIFPLYALYPSRHLPAAKVKAFIDFVEEVL